MSGDYNSTDWLLRSYAVTRGASCVCCGSTRDLVAHHKIPRSYGGGDDFSNLEPVCRRCHRGAESRAVMAAIAAGRKRIAPAVKPPPGFLELLARYRKAA